MSHLRAPAERAARREGGRHGRPGRTVPPLPGPHIRGQLSRIAVLPAVAVALSATAAVLFTVRASTTPAGPVLWIVLAAALAVALAAIVIAAVAARRSARALGDRIGELGRASAEGREAVRELVAALGRGEITPEAPTLTADGTGPGLPGDEDPGDDPGGDGLDRLARELDRSRETAVRAVHHAAQLSGRAGSEQKVEVFVNLARRLQSLVHREITILDELENEVEDPELLKGLFHVDHLATRIRRHAENLAVLGGAVSRRQWSSPVSLHEVMRSAIAEVEQYSRVRLVPPIEGSLQGHAVADVVHLMAELVENATVFSAPHTEVLLRVAPVTSGLAVEVEDRGLGMPTEEQSRMNALLTAPDQIKVASLLQDGRIGLLVVSQLAHRHGIVVRLQTNIYGGTQAVLVLPQDLLGSGGGPARAAAARELPAPRPAPRAVPAAPRAGTVPPGARPAPTTGPRPSATAPAAPAVPGRPTPLPVRDSRSVRRIAAPQPPPADRALPVDRAVRADQGAPGGPSAGDGGTGPGASAPRTTPPGPRPPAPGPTAALPAPVPPPRAMAPHGGEPVEERPTARLLPRGGLRAAKDRPVLPKRQAQQHLVPQLRQAPDRRRASRGPSGEADPGLMAAFQRGVGLAEAQYAQRVRDERLAPLPPTAPEPPRPDPAADHPRPPTPDHPRPTTPDRLRPPTPEPPRPGTARTLPEYPLPTAPEHFAPGGPSAPGAPGAPEALDHPAVDPPAGTVPGGDGGRPPVLTALDVPAHELPPLTRTPIHDLALSAFAAGRLATPPVPPPTVRGVRPGPVDEGPPPASGTPTP
ncbi:ATP-binding protein [Streptomyces sp. JNUCC 64]